MSGISGFATLCTRHGLFQPHPGPRYRLLAPDDFLRSGDETKGGYAAAGWRRTGYGESGALITVAQVQASEAEFLPAEHQCFAFRRENP